ncbi:carboxymuconolactone decarboxylase family protein [Roseovarius sp. PS-C2]|uniref:carboxymuconolactone decarboxylase family protein n=1 Tax=Roseovarius sp. PS-C2 TaxID=2820814 RepID=UPI001C0C19FA|nr:carboxymuconolactone decarboxylase family protein [Roseovarius sp. PS-C2]MBU3259553.1 carboxymuconolactone decarboxylase family protein [Roseovarius sp. PS-C2]
MTRIALPPSIETAPTAAQPLLAGVKKMLGSVPNLFRITANSPAALEGYLGLNGALAKGSLDTRTRERIALAVAQVNGCDYCLAAHTYLGTHVAKLDKAEIAANRAGKSQDVKAEAAIRFAVALVIERGHVADADVSAIKAAGYSEAEIVEIVAHVAINTLTNYLNSALDTPIDFPVVSPKVA